MSDFDKIFNKSKDLIVKAGSDVANGIKNIDAEKSINDIASTTSKVLDSTIKSSQRLVENFSKKEVVNDNLTIEGTLTIIYYLMNCDGKITKEEKENFDLIIDQIKVDENIDVDKIIKDVDIFVNRLNNDDILANETNYLKDIIKNSQNSKKSVVSPKLLIWDLITISYADGDYSYPENALIEKISNLLGLENSLVPIMINSYKSVEGVNNGIQSIKELNISDKEKQELIYKLNDRKELIKHGITALLMD